MPPAGNATIALIGLVGQACAFASMLVQAKPRIDSDIAKIRFILSSSDVLGVALARWPRLFPQGAPSMVQVVQYINFLIFYADLA